MEQIDLSIRGPPTQIPATTVPSMPTKSSPAEEANTNCLQAEAFDYVPWETLELSIQYLILTTLQKPGKIGYNVALQLGLTHTQLCSMQEKVNLRRLYPESSDHIRQYCQAAGWGASSIDSVALFQTYSDYLHFATSYESADANSVEQGKLFLRQRGLDDHLLDVFADEEGPGVDSVKACPPLYQSKPKAVTSHTTTKKCTVASQSTPKTDCQSRPAWSPISNHDGIEERIDQIQSGISRSTSQLSDNINSADVKSSTLAASSYPQAPSQGGQFNSNPDCEHQRLATTAQAALTALKTAQLTPNQPSGASHKLMPKAIKHRRKRGLYKKTRERLARVEAEIVDKKEKFHTQIKKETGDEADQSVIATPGL